HRKTDKETQSPVTKVFQEIMKREQSDPEKANLLNEKHSNRKRRQHNTSRTKLSHARLQNPSSEQKISNVTSMTAQNVNRKNIPDQKLSSSDQNVFQSDNKDSCWRFWTHEAQKQNSEDTQSCVSCALKKLITSEYTCMVCLGVIFFLSVGFVFCLLIRSEWIMTTPNQMAGKNPSHLNSEIIKNKQQRLKSNDDEGDTRMTANKDDSWRDLVSRGFSGLAGYVNNGYGGEYNGNANFLDYNLKPESEVPLVLDAEQLNMGLNSERLRNFYTKLLQTDVQIRNLKKNYNGYKKKLDNDKFNFMANRKKRSPRFSHFNSDNSTYVRSVNRTKKSNMTRFQNPLIEPTGWIVKRKHIFEKYEPNEKRIIPKCSHAPKELKSHEIQMKHPFYKNTQRVDDLLDYGYESLLKNNGEKFNEKPIKNEPTANDKNHKSFSGEKASEPLNFMQIFDNNLIQEFKEPSITSSTLRKGLISSSIENPKSNKENLMIDTFHHSQLRKLFQVYEENEEDIGYDDINEVLADEIENHDDDSHERGKRMDKFKIENNPTKTEFHNQNWKGPMPLYSDELLSMINQAAMQNVDIASRETAIGDNRDMSKLNSIERNVGDMEYKDNYSDRKLNKLVEMAQAYSDYGVLDEKKDDTKKRVKLSINKGKLLRNSGKKTEDISLKVEWINPKNNRTYDILKPFRKHMKFGFSQNKMNTKFHSSTESLDSTQDITEKILGKNSFPVLKGKLRSLLSILGDDFDTNVAKLTRLKKSIDKKDIPNVEKNINNSIAVSVKPINVNGFANKTGEMNLSNFLAMVSNWFTTLAESTFQNKSTNIWNNLTNLTQTNSNKLMKTPKSRDVTDVIYPNYDADMIENIGHRSRVLMSVDEKLQVPVVTSKNATENKLIKQIGLPNKKSEMSTKAVTAFPNNTFTGAGIYIVPTLVSDSTLFENKSKVKRNPLTDTNSINWEGIYDDEYGVKLDSGVNSAGNNQLAKSLDFVKKSGNWLQDTVRNIAKNVHGKGKSVVTISKQGKSRIKSRYIRSATRPISALKRIHNKNRATTNEQTGENNENFQSLMAKMTKVCKEAAVTVQKSQNSQVHQKDKDKLMSASLMQQLTRLMTDLVDIEVQERTCLKLPPDLQKFLIWLTSVNTDEHKTAIREDDLHFDEALPDSVDIRDTRSDCLGTLHAVEELIQEYGEFSEEDKSKMIGIKDYLESQLAYLRGQLSSAAEYELSNLYQYETMRYRRDAKDKTKNHFGIQKKHDLRLKGVFVKNNRRKCTRTTDQIYGASPTTNTINYINSGGYKNYRVIKKYIFSNNSEVNKHLNSNKHKEESPKKVLDIKKEDVDDGFVNVHIVRVEK
ncbi:hypothetical protein ACJJTC_010973, partial [Scirpophaga incertulas]